VLTSPLKRAQQTCALVGLDQVLEIEPDLVEWDYGTASISIFAFDPHHPDVPVIALWNVSHEILNCQKLV